MLVRRYNALEMLTADVLPAYSQGSRECGGTMVKVLCYKSECRWFDPRGCHWNFSLTESFRSHYGPGVDSASNRNEHQENFLGVNAAGA